MSGKNQQTIETNPVSSPNINTNSDLAHLNILPQGAPEGNDIKINPELSNYTLPGYITLTPFTVTGDSGEVQLGHLYDFGGWKTSLITLPNSTKVEDHTDVFGKAGKLSHSVGSIFCGDQNPGFDPSHLIRITSTKEQEIIKDYALNCLSYILRANKIGVVNAALAETSVANPNAVKSLHWKFDEFIVSSEEFVKDVNYNEATANFQPHRGMNASALYQTLTELSRNTEVIVSKFEDSKELFEEEDLKISKLTEKLLDKHIPIFTRQPNHLDNQSQVSEEEFNLWDNFGSDEKPKLALSSPDVSQDPKPKKRVKVDDINVEDSSTQNKKTKSEFTKFDNIDPGDLDPGML